MTTTVPVTLAPTKLAKGLNARTAPNAAKANKDAKKKPVKAAAKKAPAKKASASAKKASTARTSAVADMCRQLGIAPPLGRAKLRRAGLKAPYNDMAKVRSILTGKAE